MTKVALTTGSSRGIGSEIAQAFASAGFHSIVTYRLNKLRGQAVIDTIRDTGGQASRLV